MDIKPLPVSNEVWTHDKTGNLYLVLTLVNKTTEDPEKFPVSVLYTPLLEGDNYLGVRLGLPAVLWTRPAAEFVDKFTRHDELNSQWRDRNGGTTYKVIGARLEAGVHTAVLEEIRNVVDKQQSGRVKLSVAVTALRDKYMQLKNPPKA